MNFKRTFIKSLVGFTLVILMSINVYADDYIALKLPTYGVYLGMSKTEWVHDRPVKNAIIEVQQQIYIVNVPSDFEKPTGWITERVAGSIVNVVFCISEDDKLIKVYVTK